MAKLPKMVYADRIGSTTQIAFGGLRHHVNCSDGELYDMENISVEHYPIMSARKERGAMEAVHQSVRHIYADNHAFLQVLPDGLYYGNWRLIEVLQDYENTYFVRFGDRVVMMPDKKLLNTKYPIIGMGSSIQERPDTAQLHEAFAVHDEGGHYIVWVYDGTQWVDNGWFDEPIESNSGLNNFSSVTVKNGEIYEEEASANTLHVSNPYELITSSLRLRPGDAVTISGMTVEPRNNKTAIIREIARGRLGGCDIRFSDYCFYIPEDADSYVEENIRIARTMPDMDFLFEHGNRLWGAKGKEIFASKLGDGRNWNVFDGLATDSWYVETQSKGNFTAGIGYGYPRLFKEDSMITVYGSIPSAFQLQEVPINGVMEGEHKSLAPCGGRLLWLSRQGMVLYDGSAARVQEQVFGNWKIAKAISMACANKCYVAAKIEADPPERDAPTRAVFCFDAVRGLWTKESSPGEIYSMTYDQGLVYAVAAEKGYIISLNEKGNSPSADENPLRSFAEFGDFTDGSLNRKAVNKLLLRMEIEENASVAVYIRYDGEEDWHLIKELSAGGKRSECLAVRPRRCDHYRIKISGTGHWKLFSMARELYVGSELH